LQYEVNLKNELGHRILNIKIGNQPVEFSRSYHVTMNSFLASGGDGFWQFNQAPTITGGELDIDALSEYLRQHPDIQPPKTDRIKLL
jgi:5'-nucleotidase